MPVKLIFSLLNKDSILFVLFIRAAKIGSIFNGEKRFVTFCEIVCIVCVLFLRLCSFLRLSSFFRLSSF